MTNRKMENISARNRREAAKKMPWAVKIVKMGGDLWIGFSHIQMFEDYIMGGVA